MKKFLIGIFVAALLFLAAALVLPLLLEAQISRQIRREAAERLDVRLDFRRASISLLRRFPCPSLELRGLTLIGTGRFEGDTLLTVERISAAVDIASLFSDEGFDLRKVTFVHPVVRAHKLADGAENWNILKSAPGATEDPAEREELRFALRDLRITQGALRYRNDSTRVRFTASPVALRLRGDLAASESDLALRVDAGAIRLVSGSAVLISKADVLLDATVAGEKARRKFTFKENTLRINAIEVSLDGWFDLLTPGEVAMDIRADCSRVQFKEVLSMVPAFYTDDYNNLAASGRLTLSAWARGKAHDSHLPAFEVVLGVEEGRFQYSSLPKAVTDIRIAARVASGGGTLDRATLDISEFSALVAGNPLHASLSVSTPLSDLHFDASAKGMLDLGTLRKVYPVDERSGLKGRIMADVHVAGRYSDIDSQRYEAVDASGSFVVERVSARMRGLPDVTIRRAAVTLNPASMTVGELDLTIGGSDLTANGQLTGYIGHLLDGKPLSGRLYVKSDLLDLNEIMAAIPPAPGVPADMTTTSPIIVPRELALILSADIGKIRLGKMTFTDFTGEIRTADGTAFLNRLSMKAFGGTMLASGSYSTATDVQCPELTLALDISHASFVRTFEEFGLVRRIVPLFQKASGDYSMTLDLSAQLDASMSPELPTLSARGELRSAEVRAAGIPALDRLAEVLHDNKLRTLAARDVAIGFLVARRRIVTEPFDLRLGDVKLTFAGSTGFDRTVNYTVRATMPAQTIGLRASVDVRISGTVEAPKIMLGLAEASYGVMSKSLLGDQVGR